MVWAAGGGGARPTARMWTAQMKKGSPRGLPFSLIPVVSPVSGEGAGELFALEDLDDIAFADILVILERHAAFLP